MSAIHRFHPPSRESKSREQPLLRIVIPDATEVSSLQVKSGSHLPRYNARFAAGSLDGLTEVELFRKRSFLGAKNPPRLDRVGLDRNPAAKSPQQRQRRCAQQIPSNGSFCGTAQTRDRLSDVSDAQHRGETRRSQPTVATDEEGPRLKMTFRLTPGTRQRR